MEQMGLLRHLSGFCLAAILLVAAMLFAPSGAYAHAGHDHGLVKVQNTAARPHVTGTVTIRQELKGDAVTVQRRLLLSALISSAGKATAPCTGGCCHSAGHGCCAVALPKNLTLDQPTDRPPRVFARFLWGPGVTPGALPEPPKSLV
jgi:hypothetical protein